MALLYSPKQENNFLIPEFNLPAVSGENFSSSDFNKYDLKVFFFICNHCPYVKAIEDRIIKLYKQLKPKNIIFIGICSNDAADYPEDSFDNIKKTWQSKNYEFPYLYDETQEVAKAFGAICTPDIFAFDQNNKLFYRGQLDNSWRTPQSVSREDLKLALEAKLAGNELTFDQTPSMGCSIKWKDY